MFLENVLNYQESVADIILFIYFGRTGSLLPCRLSPFAFPGGSVGKESACNAGDPGSIPGSGRSPGEGKGSPLQYSGLENSVDCVVYGVAESRTRLSIFCFHRLSLVALSGGSSFLGCEGFSLQPLCPLWSPGGRQAGFRSCSGGF